MLFFLTVWFSAFNKLGSTGVPVSMAFSIISAILLVSFCFVLITSQTIVTGITTHMKRGRIMSSIIVFEFVINNYRNQCGSIC